MRESNRQNLRIGVQEPYFGRLDFQEDGKEEVMPIYIGKVGVSDMDTMKPIIIDWRAPVASMFYSYRWRRISILSITGWVSRR